MGAWIPQSAGELRRAAAKLIATILVEEINIKRSAEPSPEVSEKIQTVKNRVLLDTGAALTDSEIDVEINNIGAALLRRA